MWMGEWSFIFGVGEDAQMSGFGHVPCEVAAACWAAILKHLPKGDVVFDHFHIVKLINEKIDDLRRSLQRAADILGGTYLKGTRYLSLAEAKNVPQNMKKPCQALSFNHPLSTAYYLKEDLPNSGASQPWHSCESIRKIGARGL